MAIGDGPFEWREDLEASERAWFPPGLGEKIVSDAQMRANRRNAAASTGPRTEAGRAEAARNSLRHGLYATTGSAIPRGALREDPDAVARFVEERVDAMRPRDAVESSIAAEIARTFLKLSRVDAFGTQMLAGDGKTDPALRAPGSLPQDETGLRYLAGIADMLFQFVRPESPLREKDVDFEDLARFIRVQKTDGKMRIRDLWTETVTPSSRSEWKRAFRVLRKHAFTDEAELEIWAATKAYELHERLEFAKGRSHEVAATRAINGTFEVVGRHRSRALRELEQLLGIYGRLQQRVVRDEAPQGGGTNPNSQGSEAESESE